MALARALAMAVLTWLAAAAGFALSASVRNHACKRSFCTVTVDDALTVTAD